MFAWQHARSSISSIACCRRSSQPLRAALAGPVAARAQALARAYARVPSISIDYGVMEHAKDVLVVAGDFGWSDVGSWAALAALDGAAAVAHVVPIDAERSVVFGNGRLVAVVGVDDLIVVDTPDAIFVCHRDRAQDVRRVVDELKRRGLERYL